MADLILARPLTASPRGHLAHIRAEKEKSETPFLNESKQRKEKRFYCRLKRNSILTAELRRQDLVARFCTFFWISPQSQS